MFSEKEFLVRQLEYCFNTRSEKPLEKILRDLIDFKSKIKITYSLHYKCHSHIHNFGENKYFDSGSNIFYIQPCNHYICRDCLIKHIEPIYLNSGINGYYYCPGCTSAYALVQTPLYPIESYINQLFSKEFIIAATENQVKTLNTIRSKRVQANTLKCYFRINPGKIRCSSGSSNLFQMISCNHHVCPDCLCEYLKTTIHQAQVLCVDPRCENPIPHYFIRVAVSTNSQLAEYYWKKLRIEGEVHLFCSCNNPLIIKSTEREHRCKCGNIICVLCGENAHGEIPCEVAKLNLNDYAEYILEPSSDHYKFAERCFE